MGGRFRAVAGSVVVCAAAGLVLAVISGCSEQSRYMNVPSNHRRLLDDALQRLHAVGLSASFDAVSVSCGSGLPTVMVQSPRAPARVRQHTDVRLTFQAFPLGSQSVPQKRPRWTYVPSLVGKELSVAVDRLNAIEPCVRVRSASATSATRLIVVSQNPPAGTRVPAYGVVVMSPLGRGWRQTTMRLVAAAQ